MFNYYSVISLWTSIFFKRKTNISPDDFKPLCRGEDVCVSRRSESEERRTGQVKDESDGNEVEVRPNERASLHSSAF